jgi:hypothetical protein
MAISRADTFMGLAPGLNSSGEFILNNAKFGLNSTRLAANTTASSIAAADSGTFFLINSQTTAVDINLPYPEAGAFYGFVSLYASSVGQITFQGPTTAVQFYVGGGAGADSSNVQLVTTGTAFGAVVGFLGLNSSHYAFLDFTPLSSAYSSDAAAGIMALWGEQ